MGVVTGIIEFEGIASPYQFFRDYCLKHNVPTNKDDPEYEAISTQSIKDIKVFNEAGLEIKGEGTTVSGFREEGPYMGNKYIPLTSSAS